MVQNPPADMPPITASLAYEDPAAAIEWLTRAYGFRTRIVIPDESGAVIHAELVYGEGVVMIGPSGARPEFRSPRALGGANTGGLYVYVEDVEAHHLQALAAGAEILSAPETQFYGDRNYATLDLEGHRWTFGQHLEDVSLDEFKPEA